MKHRLVVTKLKIVTHYIWPPLFFLTSGPLKEKKICEALSLSSHCYHLEPFSLNVVWGPVVYLGVC